MAVDIRNDFPINFAAAGAKQSPDDRSAQFEPLLKDLQGNILRSHGRENLLLLPIRFTCSDREARGWVSAFGGWVTSAYAQNRQTLDWLSRRSENLFTNLFLTRSGYDYLDIRDETKIPSDPKFRAGMAQSQKSLSDPSQSTWDKLYQEPIHAMVLFAAADLDRPLIRATIDTAVDSLKRIAEPLIPQKGKALRQNRPGAGNPRYLEHFNYLEGRSQPLFFAEDLDEERNTDGIIPWNPFASLDLVLVKDPGGGEHGFGSYLVYRKLEQKVRAFKERERQLAKELDLASPHQRIVGPMVLGRFENGTPLGLSGSDNLGSAPNNFNYENDPHGIRCPHFAHIRKMNPRTEESKTHRIVRRGIPYSDSEPEISAGAEHFNQKVEKMAESGVGLLFMCFQSSIENQFEHLQRLASNPDAPVAGAGIDALIDQGDRLCDWPVQWGESLRRKGSFGAFVNLRGGEYFFAPSISFFRSLT